jgi:FAD/FMN-containing dehydrogenase
VRLFRPESEADLTDWIAVSRDRFPEEGVPVVTAATGDPAVRGLDPLPRLGVSTSSLSGVVDFRPKDLTITVGAGMRLSALDDLVAAAGLWLPLAGMPENRSVGGWVASAPAGEFDGSFGPVRRHVLACSLLLWDGRITRWGRPVMKNVAGYDVNKLVCGSRARLGIVTSVTLRLWPRPRVVRRFDLEGEALREHGAAFAGAPRFEAAVWRCRPGGGNPIMASVSITGGPKSVSSRAEALECWAGDRDIGIKEEDPESMGPAPTSGDRSARPSGSAAYRITFGRRYLKAGLRDLDRRLAADVDPWSLEAFPATGVVRLLTAQQKAAGQRQAPAWLTTIADTVGGAAVPQPALDSPAVRVERGGQAEHDAARRMRSTTSRDIERRWLGAFAGLEGPWQADYL